jgi:tryptophanyl-tRNA synthetase
MVKGKLGKGMNSFLKDVQSKRKKIEDGKKVKQDCFE